MGQKKADFAPSANLQNGIRFYGSGLPISELVVYAKLEVLSFVEVFLDEPE